MNMLVEIEIGETPHQIKPGVIKGVVLHNLAELVPPQQLVISRRGAMDIPVGSEDYVIIEGDEKLTVGDGDPPLEDNPSLRKGIKYFLNGEKYSGNEALDKAKLTGAEIKALDPNSQPTDGLFAELNGFADEPIQNNWRIVVQDKDSFITVPCGNVGESAAPAIQPFETQLAELKKQYGQVEVQQNGAMRTVIIRSFKLPEGWDRVHVDLMVQVPQTYPPAALDMFWVSPHVKLPSGAWPDRGDQFEDHADTKWQRFSWHYQGRPWQPARDTLFSHFRFCISRLNQLK